MLMTRICNRKYDVFVTGSPKALWAVGCWGAATSLRWVSRCRCLERCQQHGGSNLCGWSFTIYSFSANPPQEIENGVFFFFGATSKQLTWAHLGPASVRRNSPSPFLPGKATPGLFFVAKDSIVREEKSGVRCEWWNLMRQIWDFWVTLGYPFNGWDTQCSDWRKAQLVSKCKLQASSARGRLKVGPWAFYSNLKPGVSILEEVRLR